MIQGCGDCNGHRIRPGKAVSVREDNMIAEHDLPGVAGLDPSDMARYEALLGPLDSANLTQ